MNENSKTYEISGPLGRIGEKLISLSAKSEQSKAYNGVLSYAAEWHSAMLGLGAGIAGSPAQQTLVVSYALGKAGERQTRNADAHLKDVADEPAYALAALAAGRALRSGATIGGILPL